MFICIIAQLHPQEETGVSWTDVAVALVAGIGGPNAEVAGLVRNMPA